MKGLLVPESYVVTKRIHTCHYDVQNDAVLWEDTAKWSILCVWLCDILLCHRQNMLGGSCWISVWEMQHGIWKSKHTVTRYSKRAAGGHCASSSIQFLVSRTSQVPLMGPALTFRALNTPCHVSPVIKTNLMSLSNLYVYVLASIQSVFRTQIQIN